MGAGRFARGLIVCAVAAAASSASRTGRAQSAEEAQGGQWPAGYGLATGEASEPARPSRAPVVLAPVRVPPWWAQPSEGGDASSQPRPTLAQGEWYGWQTLLVDGSSLFVGVGGLMLGVALGSPAFGITAATLGGVSMIFGAPVVHWVRGHNTRGFVSLFGYRLGLAAVGYAVGGGALFPLLGIYAIAITGPALAGLGLITGIILDAVFAREPPRSSDESAARRARRVGPTLVPMPVGGQMGLGLVGTF